MTPKEYDAFPPAVLVHFDARPVQLSERLLGRPFLLFRVLSNKVSSKKTSQRYIGLTL